MPLSFPNKDCFAPELQVACSFVRFGLTLQSWLYDSAVPLLIERQAGIEAAVEAQESAAGLVSVEVEAGVGVWVEDWRSSVTFCNQDDSGVC